MCLSAIDTISGGYTRPLFFTRLSIRKIMGIAKHLFDLIMWNLRFSSFMGEILRVYIYIWEKIFYRWWSRLLLRFHVYVVILHFIVRLLWLFAMSLSFMKKNKYVHYMHISGPLMDTMNILPIICIFLHFPFSQLFFHFIPQKYRKSIDRWFVVFSNSHNISTSLQWL